MTRSRLLTSCSNRSKTCGPTVTTCPRLGANVTPGGAAVIERMTATTAMLSAKGMDAVAASRAATNLMGRLVTSQSTVIAFDTAFIAVALLFVIAAPMLVGIKIGFSRYEKVCASRPVA